jgi:hypothetical protein
MSDDLASVRVQLEAGEYKPALKMLKQLEKAFPELDALVEQRELSTMWLYRGVAEHLRGAKKDRDVNAWRQALIIDNEVPWDTSLVESDDSFGLFEALRGEVRSRNTRSPGIPEMTGAAELYVNGVRLREDEPMLEGIHLAQIKCPDEQGVFSTVTDFSQPVDWFALCPDGVDTSVVINEDEWAEFGPVFGPSPDETNPAPDEVAVTPDAVPVTPDEVAVTPDAVPVTPDEVAVIPDAVPVTPDAVAVVPDAVAVVSEPRRRTPNTALLTTGGILLVSGSVVNFAMVNPAYAEIEAANAAPRSISRLEADKLVTRFDMARYTTLGLLGAGLVSTGVGFFVDAPVRPVVGWGVLGVSGQF